MHTKHKELFWISTFCIFESSSLPGIYDGLYFLF